jgi:hypothetical protein
MVVSSAAYTLHNATAPCHVPAADPDAQVMFDRAPPVDYLEGNQGTNIGNHRRSLPQRAV